MNVRKPKKNYRVRVRNSNSILTKSALGKGQGELSLFCRGEVLAHMCCTLLQKLMCWSNKQVTKCSDRWIPNIVGTGRQEADVSCPFSWWSKSSLWPRCTDQAEKDFIPHTSPHTDFSCFLIYFTKILFLSRSRRGLLRPVLLPWMRMAQRDPV